MVSNFVFQENQYRGPLCPCIPVVFNRTVDSQDVDWRIGMRQEVENAIAKGLPLDGYVANGRFQSFCQKHAEEASFQKLSTEQRLLQWTNSLKTGLPCLIYGAKGFKGSQRKLEDIIVGTLFMFDADHLPCDPEEIFQRTQVEGFPWQVALAHITSSGRGLRLVCVSRPELGNIADNQICLARDLRILDMVGTTGKPVVDDSCIDASRISYAPRRQDILYINEELLFGTDTDDEGDSEMEQLYGDLYRQGRGNCNPIHSENRFHNDKASSSDVETSKQSNQQQQSQVVANKELPLVFGHQVMDYINTLLPDGAPKGQRHPTMLKLANDLMILLDNDEKQVKQALMRIEWVRDIVKERNEKEVDNVIDSAKKTAEETRE